MKDGHLSSTGVKREKHQPTVITTQVFEWKMILGERLKEVNYLCHFTQNGKKTGH